MPAPSKAKQVPRQPKRRAGRSRRQRRTSSAARTLASVRVCNVSAPSRVSRAASARARTLIGIMRMRGSLRSNGDSRIWMAAGMAGVAWCAQRRHGGAKAEAPKRTAHGRLLKHKREIPRSSADGGRAGLVSFRRQEARGIAACASPERARVLDGGSNALEGRVLKRRDNEDLDGRRSACDASGGDAVGAMQSDRSERDVAGASSASAAGGGDLPDAIGAAHLQPRRRALDRASMVDERNEHLQQDRADGDPADAVAADRACHP